jgi:hypothetical protein
LLRCPRHSHEQKVRWNKNRPANGATSAVAFTYSRNRPSLVAKNRNDHLPPLYRV